MANRIQLRRDTAANWTRVNPVLEDGEPGLEIETNRVKYGDGNTAWADLDYTGGGSVSFDYSTVQEGTAGPSNLTSITGGNDTGVSLTSDNWAQLMWVPNTANVTIADIGNGPATYNWAYVDEDGFRVESNVAGVKRHWQFTTNGNLNLPQGGRIGETPSPTFVGNAVVITPANGTDDNQQLMIYPTQNEGNHLHLTSGNLAVTDILLGDDDQYIRTRTDGGMTIGTGGGEMWGGWAWTFGANAVLSVPYEGLIRATDDSISLQTHDTVANVTHGVRLGTSGSLFLENATNNVQWLQIDTFAGNTRFQSNGGASIKTDSGGSEWSWLFANTGVLTTPGNVQVGTTGTYGNISFVDTIQANNYVYANGVSILDGITGTYGNTEVAAYLAGEVTTGNLTVGNLIVTGNSTVINTESYVVADNIIQMANANPADILDLGFVAHRTVNSTLEHTGLVRDADAGIWRLFSNVTEQPGSTVDFTNADYDVLQVGGLNTVAIAATGPVNFTASPPAYSTPGIQWNSGFQSDIYGNTQVAAYLVDNPQGSTYSNANVVANLQNFVTSISTTANITTTANVIAPHYLFANGVNILSTISAGSSYANANAAAYLLTYVNANVANLNATSGNITTLRTTNFSTANAVISGGYATGLANITVTAGANIAGVGNIIGSTANTTITAGAYTSSFLSNGMIVIGGNLTVSGNINNVVTKASFIGAVGTATTLDNISANWNGGPSQFQIGTVSGSILAHWNTQTSLNGTFTVSSNNGTLTTSPTNFGGTAGTAGDAITVMLTDITNGRFYRITGHIGPSYLNSPVIIERVV